MAREAGLADDAASAARAGYVRAYDKARAAGDIEAMAEAALGLAATQTFGTFPGRVPAFLHEAYSLARGELDKQALSAYRRRLAEIDADLDEARSWADTGRAAKLSAERDALLDQLRAATGLGGRPRVPGSAHERARIAVRKAIVNAIDRVAAADPSLGRLLSDTVTTGAICR